MLAWARHHPRRLLCLALLLPAAQVGAGGLPGTVAVVLPSGPAPIDAAPAPVASIDLALLRLFASRAPPFLLR